MTLVENIVGTIMVLFFFLIAGMIITANITKTTKENIEAKEMSFFDDQYANNVNSLLLISERNTRKPMANLLGSALYYRNNTFNFRNQTVNITAQFEELLDAVFGKGKYYMLIRPQVKEIGLKFIIDGSPSLDDERQELADNLHLIVQEAAKGDKTVDVAIYILKDDIEICGKFFPGPSLWDGIRQKLGMADTKLVGSCETIHGEESNKDGDYIYVVEEEHDYRQEFGINAPYTLEQFRQTGRELAEFYESDWASGSAFASNEANERIFALVNILFPMSEELAGSSKPDECLLETSWRSSSKADEGRRFFCDTCWQSCDLDGNSLTPTEERSKNLIVNATNFIVSNNHIVNPILATGCNFQAERDVDVWRGRNLAYNDNNLGGRVVNPRDTIDAGILGNSFCRDTNCGGCSIKSGVADQTQFYKNVCFHSNCQNFELENQMRLMADATGGNVIKLEDLDSLTYEVRQSINRNLENIKIELGVKRNESERYVFHRVLPLPKEQRFADFSLFVYKGVGGKFE